MAVTIIVSLATKPHSDESLHGLVHGLSQIPKEKGPWYVRPVPLAFAVGGILILLNLWFR